MLVIDIRVHGGLSSNPVIWVAIIPGPKEPQLDVVDNFLRSIVDEIASNGFCAQGSY